MAWKLDTRTTGSLSDGATKLPVGTNTFKIVDAKQVPDKSDPRGKAMQVAISLALGERTYKTFLSVESTKEVVCEIALKTLRDFFVSAGITGVLSPARLPALVGKSVVIEVVERSGTGDNASKTYTNIASIEPVDSGVETVEEEEEEEEEAPAPEPVKKGKTKPAPTPEPESEEDEDEEEEDEDEEEAPAPAKAAKKKNPWD